MVCFNNQSLKINYSSYFAKVFKDPVLTYLDSCIGEGCNIAAAGGISRDEFPYNMSFQTMAAYLPRLINIILNMGSKSNDVVPDMINLHIKSKPFYFTRFDEGSDKVPTYKTAKNLEDSGCTLADLNSADSICQQKLRQYLQYNAIHKIQESYLSQSVTGRSLDTSTSVLAGGDPTRSVDKT